MLKDLLQELHIEECADGTGAGAAQDAASIQMVADCTAKVIAGGFLCLVPLMHG